MTHPRYPLLYQINTRVYLRQLGRELNRPATLDDIPDAELDDLARLGYDWIWFLGVWQTGAAARQVSLANPEWRHEFQDTLPDLSDDDICGSCFAITGYTVHAELGGDEAMRRLRERLRQRGMKLMLDFVPNHMAPDHPWVHEHPDYFVRGNASDLAREPQNYCQMSGALGTDMVVYAYGRDPYFAGWPDTLQLNYGNPALQEAMTGELMKIASLCDGVRCDMAMLILPDVFERTWGVRPQPFWPQATGRVRAQHPGFIFMAEVYWDLEWTLQQQGFDYTYDKRLYDRLRDQHTRPAREHLCADLNYQEHMARFLENHDEPRAAATFPPDVHQAAAIVTFLTPGLKFFHQGQLEGRKKRISPHLCRGPSEPTDYTVQSFYARLLECLQRPAVRNGDWRLLACVPAWEGNWTWDCFIAWTWQEQDGERLMAVVNYAPNQSQCYVRLPFADLRGQSWELRDLMGSAHYVRPGDDLEARGLYLDMPPWAYHVFVLAPAS